MAEPKITITDGAYMVEGDIPLYQDAIVESEDGTHLEYKRMRQIDAPSGTYLLCRCGRSSIKPFCDYAHALKDPPFDGAETADMSSYEERATVMEGCGVKLHDDGRCAFARLCHYDNETVWQIIRKDDPTAKQHVIDISVNCPTGRLVVIDSETSQDYEQEFEPSITILEDVGLGCSGPLFVRGGVALVSQDGTEYERRNRYALCRCGASKDLPFCDAAHHHVGFCDELS